MSLKAASIYLYGKEDHGRLRHELDGDAPFSVARLGRLPNAVLETLFELIGDARGLRLMAGNTLDRFLRVTIGAPAPAPVAGRKEEEPCEAFVASR